jgi:transposase
MARHPRGAEVLEVAQKQLSQARDADELRVLLAVVMPLGHRLSTEETAKLVGRSVRWVTQSRNDYIRRGGTEKEAPAKKRNRANMTTEEEEAFLESFLDGARRGQMLVVREFHRALEEHLGHQVALASAYNLLHRQGWRKLAPDKRNLAADVKAQDEWKKNCRKSSDRFGKVGKERGHCA